MKSLFETETHYEVLTRIEGLNESSKGLWGKMEVGQMLHHCQFPLSLALGRYEMKKPSLIMKLLFKSFKKGMYDNKPWKPNMPTAKPFKVLDRKNFEPEKETLVDLINDFHQEKNRKTWEPHPAFGVFTHEQWGQMQYKHLDHHLRQFGV
ncbi:DUF1569 domain-containing protein [Flagellimonas pacifica]|uniref:DUF1569 domain-containing protein n=1 Tax=Flagellimonas pacifica TaxID=1247520 RepID=A0A285MWK8_9FLAO|nr:DUF1569 domain-containing protein [Allomuricauda parva]SNZ01564.1 Protein of unknown function [Allomuricauda parva]